MPVAVLIFIILLTATIIIIAILSRRKESALSEFCNSDSDCPKTMMCMPNPQNEDKKQCFDANKFFCTAFPFTALTKCSLSDPNSCGMCLNDPTFTCVEVSKEKPYTWVKDGGVVQLPFSEPGYGWCLPNIQNRDITCNSFTSDYVLQEVGDGVYQWGCHCKYPTLFDHADGGTSSDCTHPVACGSDNGFGKLFVPTSKGCKNTQDCSSGDLCRSPVSPYPCGYSDSGLQPEVDCSDPKSKCVCHAQWSKETAKNTNPLTGQCVCSPGLDFQCVKRSSDYFEFNCVQGLCDPWGIDQSEKCNQKKCYTKGGTACVCCKCPEGYLRCPDDIISNNKGLASYCEHNGPTCIADPCKSTEVPDGYFDKTLGTCVCPGETSIVVEDENSPIGVVCKNPCSSTSNPCGNRGKCYVQNNQALCCDCVSPYTNVGDNSCTCAGQTGHLQKGAQCCHDYDCASGNCGHDPFCLGPSPKPGICVGDPIVSPEDKCGANTCTPKKTGPVYCGTNAECPQGSTCCQNSDKSWNCCPYEDGVCCGDNEHCCPGDHPVCAVNLGVCQKKDGSDPIPWKVPTPHA